MKNINKKFRKGFTLVEMLAVVAIMGILGSVLYISYNKYINTSKQEVAKAELLQITEMFELEMQENQTLSTAVGKQVSPSYFTTYEDVITYCEDNKIDDLNDFYETFSENTLPTGSTLGYNSTKKYITYNYHDVTVNYNYDTRSIVE